jgi:hypothetical protein
MSSMLTQKNSAWYRDRGYPGDVHCDIGITIWKSMLDEMDELRDGVPRSLWIRRLIAKELERLRNERKSLEKLRVKNDE